MPPLPKPESSLLGSLCSRPCTSPCASSLSLSSSMSFKRSSWSTGGRSGIGLAVSCKMNCRRNCAWYDTAAFCSGFAGSASHLSDSLYDLGSGIFTWPPMSLSSGSMVKSNLVLYGPSSRASKTRLLAMAWNTGLASTPFCATWLLTKKKNSRHCSTRCSALRNVAGSTPKFTWCSPRPSSRCMAGGWTCSPTVPLCPCAPPSSSTTLLMTSEWLPPCAVTFSWSSCTASANSPFASSTCTSS
mmetsp:Transcript_7577/g.26685  ORF Transcript_7577/g.26685 Transcript_7577/m.26685 type:complete len:243 (-) Transcript_7577:735-1463(-)